VEIIGTAMAISLVVGFVFFILAQHWQRVLKQQSWAIRRLTERVRDLEEMADPEFLRRLNESTPSPLEEVFTFSFRVGDSFWRQTVGLSEPDFEYVRMIGSVPGSVKIERWRGHMVARITEVMPESKAAGWNTRTLDVYPEKASKSEPVVLWEVPLARASGPDEPPSLRLVLDDALLKLEAQSASGRWSDEPAARTEDVFFSVPLDPARLVEFRSRDSLRAEDNGDSHAATDGAAWQAFYSFEDEARGFEWHLWIRDLRKKAEWDRWKILEGTPVSVDAPKP